jgi:hypothetical protein
MVGFRRGTDWRRILAGVGPVNRYTARRVAWSVGVLSIALMVAALILFLVDRSRIELPESVGSWSLLTGFDIAASIPFRSSAR